MRFNLTFAKDKDQNRIEQTKLAEERDRKEEIEKQLAVERQKLMDEMHE